jgi:hypothetical protein
MTTSAEKTLRHIARVQELLSEAAVELLRRGAVHDRSKFDPTEAEPLAQMDELIAREGNVPFGSPEYEARKALLGPMLKHHYTANSHHPEHFENGVNGMTLFDVVEMFVDWKAASERGEQSSMALAKACEKYAIAPQLADIMRNTASGLGWPVD